MPKKQQSKRVALTQGEYALIDEADYDKVKGFNWYAHKGTSKTKYAETYLRGEGGKRISMHRLIMDAPKRMQVDHINHNGLDNRKENLRLCTNAQNCRNSKSRKGTSKYKGVMWAKPNKMWRSQIVCSYKVIHLGYYDDEKKAAKAYDKKATELFGEFAYLNFGGNNV